MKIIRAVDEKFGGLPQWEVEFEDGHREYVIKEEVTICEADWTCPACKEKNTDFFFLTAQPICAGCDRDFSWEERVQTRLKKAGLLHRVQSTAGLRKTSR